MMDRVMLMNLAMSPEVHARPGASKLAHRRLNHQRGKLVLYTKVPNPMPACQEWQALRLYCSVNSFMVLNPSLNRLMIINFSPGAVELNMQLVVG